MTSDDVVVVLSTALFQSWFTKGHSGAWEPKLQEDFDAWVDCALADAQTVVDALISQGLLSVSDSAKVEDLETNDERS